jgi:hypothetical protein
MKHFLLLFAFSAAMISVQAQNPLSLSWDGEPLGDTIVVFGSQEHFEIIAHAIVTNDSDQGMNIKVRRQRLDMQEGSLSAFCWGLCYSPDVEESIESYYLGPGESCPDEHFSGHYYPYGAWGASYVKYKFFNEANEDENAEVVVMFSATITGNQDIREEIVSIYPNPASGQVTIEAPVSIQKLAVYDLTGKMVYQVETMQQKVQFNLDFLERGIYLVQLQTSQGMRTEKLYVQ